MVQLLEIYHTTQEGCIFLGPCIMALEGVVPGHALVMGKVAGKGETIVLETGAFASAITSLKRPLALNDRFKSPQGYPLYILP